MKYGNVTGVAKEVSRLCQGTDMIGSGQLDKSLAILDAAFEQGINCFDCAHIYGADGDQIAQNVSCLQIDLTPAELAWLDLAGDSR